MKAIDDSPVPEVKQEESPSKKIGSKWQEPAYITRDNI